MRKQNNKTSGSKYPIKRLRLQIAFIFLPTNASTTMVHAGNNCKPGITSTPHLRPSRSARLEGFFIAKKLKNLVVPTNVRIGQLIRVCDC